MRMPTAGFDGRLTPDDDDEAVAASLMQLLESPLYAQQLAAAARESCSAYEWAAARNGWLAAYAEAAGLTMPVPFPPHISRESV